MATEAVGPGLDADPPLPAWTTSIENRLTLALLGFENRTGDPALGFWRFAVERLLGKALKEAEALRLVFPGTYALGQLKMKGGDPVDSDRARRAGELLEAARVIWGSYERSGKKWVATAHLLNTATGKEYAEARAESGDWFKLRDELVNKLLRELKVVPTSLERERMTKRWAASSETLELMSQALQLQEQHGSHREIEGLLRRAVQSDPGCGPAQQALASDLFNQGRMAEAEAIARQVVKQFPDYAGPQEILGLIVLAQGKPDEAEGCLRMASRLDPTDASALAELGELYRMQHLGAKSMDCYEQAAKLDPLSAPIRAQLGRAHSLQGAAARAAQDLKEAERLATPDDLNAQGFLAYAYDELHDVPSALAHYEAVIAEAKNQQANPERVREFEQRVAALKRSLTPVFLEATKPKSYSAADLDAFVQQHLSQSELLLVTNPLASSPEMDRWAHELAAGATNELQKAEMLFEALARHVDPVLGGGLTAEGVFAQWRAPGASFRCSEYAALYVALSRTCGLDTYCALVDEDAFGRRVQHECACLFSGNKALLIDPSYRWFGIPHRKFTLLTDVEATAVWLSQQPNTDQKKIATELAPRLPGVRFNRISSLIDAQDLGTADQELADVLKLDPDSPEAFQAQGKLELRKGNVERSVGLLERAVAMNPDESGAQLFLGLACARSGRLREAQEALRKALPSEATEGGQDFTRRWLAWVNEQIQSAEANESDPRTAADFVRRGDTFASKKEFDKAIRDYTQAARLSPDHVAAYRHRAYVHLLQGSMDEVICDATEALRLDPEDTVSREYRAQACYHKGQFSPMISDLRKAVRLRPADPNLLSELAAQLAGCPDKKLRNGAEAVRLATQACELTNWKDWRAVATLAGACSEALDFEAAKKYEGQADKMDAPDEKTRREMRRWLGQWRSHEEPKAELKFGLAAEPEPVTGSQTNLDIGALRDSAESGDRHAEAQLAGFLNEGSHGCPTNHVEAYKWASLASYQGHTDAKHLVRELELFMSPEDLSTAKAAVQAFLEQHPALRKADQ